MHGDRVKLRNRYQVVDVDHDQSNNTDRKQDKQIVWKRYTYELHYCHGAASI